MSAGDDLISLTMTRQQLEQLRKLLSAVRSEDVPNDLQDIVYAGTTRPGAATPPAVPNSNSMVNSHDHIAHPRTLLPEEASTAGAEPGISLGNAMLSKSGEPEFRIYHHHGRATPSDSGEPEVDEEEASRAIARLSCSESPEGDVHRGVPGLSDSWEPEIDTVEADRGRAGLSDSGEPEIDIVEADSGMATPPHPRVADIASISAILSDDVDEADYSEPMGDAEPGRGRKRRPRRDRPRKRPARRRDGSCNRGGIWNKARTTSNLTTYASEVVDDFAIQCMKMSQNYESSASPLYQLRESVKGMEWKTMSISSAGSEMKNISSLCQSLDRSVRTEKILQFCTLLQEIQLVARTTELMHKRAVAGQKKSRKSILEEMPDPKPSAAAWDKYHKQGKVWAYMAAAGTIYLPMLIVAASCSSKFVTISDVDLMTIHESIKNPRQENRLGKLFLDYAIPLIARLRRDCPLSFKGILWDPQLAASLDPTTDIGQSDYIFSRFPVDLTKLKHSDSTFKKFQFNAFVSPRDKASWASCYEVIDTIPPTFLDEYAQTAFSTRPSTRASSCIGSSGYGYDGDYEVDSSPTRHSTPPPSSPPPSVRNFKGKGKGMVSASDISDVESQSSEEPLKRQRFNLHNVIARALLKTDCHDSQPIKTNYNPTLKKNTVFPWRGKSKDIRNEKTRIERELAAAAYEPKDRDDFLRAVQDNLKDGARDMSAQSYIVLDSDIVAEHSHSPIEISDKDGNTLVHMAPRMDSSKARSFLDRLKVLSSGQLESVDSKDIERYSSRHFNFYNRSSTGGGKVPQNVDPYEYREDGQGIRVSQSLPRLSKEAHVDYRQYLRMEDGLEDLFQIVREYVSKRFPSACTKLSDIVETLPISGSSPVHPFGGVVLNFNVCTRFHRDHKDDTLCLVLVLTDEECVGGELCLYEPGLVLKTHPGDMIIFRSAEVSHFNLHFKGTRGSMVFTTDSDFLRWMVRRNGWIGNISFSGGFVEGKNNNDDEDEEDDKGENDGEESQSSSS